MTESGETGVDPAAPGALLIKVIMPDGGPAVGATVTTMPDSGELIADAAGSVLFRSLEPGYYSVTADHADEGAVSAAVEVLPDQLSEVSLMLGEGGVTTTGAGDGSDSATEGSTDSTTGTDDSDSGNDTSSDEEASSDDGGSEAPMATILEPDSGTELEEGDAIVLRGTVSDDEDDPRDLELEWESSIDGPLSVEPADANGETRVQDYRPSPGQHVITLRVTDSDGLVGISNTKISVGDVDALPDPVTLERPSGTINGIDLRWSRSDDDRPFHYRVHRAEGSGDFEIIGIINDTSMVEYRDEAIKAEVEYRYQIGVQLDGGEEALSNIERISVGDFIDVRSQVEELLADPERPYLYAIDRPNNSLHFINLESRIVEKTIFVGSAPTDMDFNVGNDELLVANFGGTEISVVDLETHEIDRSFHVDISQGTWDGNPYRIVGTTGDTAVFTSLDQWNDLKLVSARDGAHLHATGSIYSPELAASLDGKSVYAAEWGITTPSVQRYDISGGMLTMVDSSGNLGPYDAAAPPGRRTRSLFVTGDGEYLFRGTQKMLAKNLKSVLGTFSEPIHAATRDGSIAVGSTNVFDGNEFTIIGPLPLESTTMAIGNDDSTVYLYDEMSSRIYDYRLPK